MDIEALLYQHLRHIDPAKCQNCLNCEKSCYRRWEQPRLKRHDYEVNYMGFLPKTCRHCYSAACMEACPFKVIERDRQGFVIYAGDCKGCGKCARACPFGSIEMISILGEGKARKRSVKCDGCAGYSNMACLENCPRGAIKDYRPDIFRIRKLLTPEGNDLEDYWREIDTRYDAELVILWMLKERGLDSMEMVSNWVPERAVTDLQHNQLVHLTGTMDFTEEGFLMASRSVRKHRLGAFLLSEHFGERNIGDAMTYRIFRMNEQNEQAICCFLGHPSGGDIPEGECCRKPPKPEKPDENKAEAA